VDAATELLGHLHAVRVAVNLSSKLLFKKC
jgi:uncharacterized Rmd1/YagE family protein